MSTTGLRRPLRRPGHAAFAAALLSALVLSGCERGPSRAQIQNDLSTRYPDCRVVQQLSGEGDADRIYYLITLDCRSAPHLREAEVGYGREQGKWQLLHFERGSAPRR